MEGKGMGRRDFLKNLAVLAGVAVASRPLEAIAESMLRACDPGGKDKLLAEACEAEGLTPVEKARLIESLRSSEAFRIIADKIKLPNKEKLTGLYPGAGSHIAPVEMARVLLEKRPDLHEVEFRLTEIDPQKLEAIKVNLQNLHQVNDKYELLAGEIRITKVGEHGTATLIPVRCGEKRITIRYLLNCTGDNFFDEPNFAASDFFIQHDSGGPGMSSIVPILIEAADKIRTTGHSIPIIAEDTRREYDAYKGTEHRSFDTELFATKIKKINSLYGHRDEEMVEEEKKRVVKTEQGATLHAGAAILELRPQIATADKNILKTILVTEGASHGITGFGENDGNANARETDLSLILEENAGARELIDSIDEKMADGFALRQTAALLNTIVYDTVLFVSKHHPTEPNAGFTKIEQTITELEKKLAKDKKAQSAIQLLKKALAAQQAGYEKKLASEKVYQEWADYITKNNLGESIRTGGKRDPHEKALFTKHQELDASWNKLCVIPFQDKAKQLREQLNHEADTIFDKYSDTAY